jgi:iron(III) transport system substrate-binding protein
MKKYLLVFAAMVLTLLVPFVLRPKGERVSGPVDGTLAIISPHVESIRTEFTRAFQRHMKETYAQHVEIQWLTPGGTSEIDKYLDTEYRAAFEGYWKKSQLDQWEDSYASAVAMSKLPADASAQLKQAREVFLNSNLGVGIDLFFGGGTHDFEKQKRKGYLVATDVTGQFGPAAIKKKHPEWFTDAVIPQTFAGQTFYDSNLCWIGNCLSSFGIVYNTDVLDRLDIYEAPKQWEDLTQPGYAGYIALADPGKSGSAAMAFEMIIQQQMQQAIAHMQKLQAQPPSATRGPIRSEAESLSYGWTRGLQIIQRIAANARYFTDAAPRPPQDVARGEAAAGMAIDFYGKTFVEKLQQPDGSCRVAYVTPPGGSAVSADPIAMFRGAPNPDLATKFMEFVLSSEGQRIWGYRAGTPGGPQRIALRRKPIRKDFYTPAEQVYASDPGEHPYENNTFIYEPKYTGATFSALRVIIRAMCLDTQDELALVWKELRDHNFPPRATENFADLRIIGYDKVVNDLSKIFNGTDKIQQARVARDLAGYFRNQYLNAAELARRGE